MGSVCAEHHHHYKFHSLISPKKALQDLNIPPRKLLSRRSDASSASSSDYFSPSSEAATAMLHKFLPYNSNNGGSSSSNGDGGSDGGGGGGGFDPDDDPYSSDEFRMYEFKVRKCTRSRSHDWTDCPFSHPGEKARRRDPRRFHYSGTVCPEYRRSGSCSQGDECDFAHGVFECWLHPARYRTEACKDGKSCKRKVCFFAHSPRELRVLPAEEDGDEKDGCTQRGKQDQQHHHHHQQHCCRYCCALSPTSTLLGLSNFSPPMSPMKAVGARPLSRYSDRVSACGSKGLSYEDMVIAELLGSLEGISLNEAMSPNKASHVQGHGHGRGLWVDVGGYESGSGIVPGDEYQQQQEYHQQQQQQQMQFSLSPSTPIRNRFFNANNESVVGGLIDESPDIGWVNDLLM
ncbi:zinc finger CCCH domain-containing protein 2-like [Chenopodium quinoa]|uniref:zinc finger CCCH domain-containing protein 2-like n=1 Tax=Chenopodium quinoa TaxID=63459 RepID=UPI000B788CE5|nr:zinc finger CCCH domain-containing protein 2-like [Chenopodium quinoa]